MGVEGVIYNEYVNNCKTYFSIDLTKGILCGSLSSSDYFISTSDNRLRKILSIRHFNNELKGKFNFTANDAFAVELKSGTRLKPGTIVNFYRKV